MKSRVLTLVLILLAVVFGLHVVARTLDGARADLTADDLYSLTPGTEALLARLDEEGVEPLTLRLYFSETAGKTLPRFIKDFVTYARYVESLLGEYERAADGRLAIEVIDPVPDSDEAQDASDAGLEGVAINQHGDQFFFGLVIETETGGREVIPFLWPDRQEALEYEVSKKIHGLLWPSGQRIGVLSSLPVMGGADNPYLAQMLAAQGRRPPERWVALQVLAESYEVEAIPADADRIDPDRFDLVLVIHPKQLPEKSLWALDEWIVRGGNALVFVDPYAIDDQPPQDPQQPWAAVQYQPSSDLDALFAAWGVRRLADRVAADFELAVRRRVDEQGPAETLIVDLRIDGETRDETLADGHPMLLGLADLRLLLAGALAAEPADGVTVTPLVTTTAAGSTLEMKPGFPGGDELTFMDVNQPARLRDRFAPGDEPVVLGMLVQGRLPAAFPDGVEYAAAPPARPPGLPPGVELPLPEDAETVRREPVPDEERGEATVAIFADVDLISDRIAFQQLPFGIVQTPNDNHKLLLNAVDYLLGAEELMQIRAKRSLERPFTRFDEIEAAAERETLERERQIRADVERFQQELREKQNEITQRNAALFEKKLVDEVERLDEQIRERNRELFEIRKARRAALEAEEAKVRFAVLGWMPTLVLVLGVALFVRRRRRLAGPPPRAAAAGAGAEPRAGRSAGSKVQPGPGRRG